jgi:hypothetical protein
MTPLNRLKALLNKGYFPEGLPPPFKTDGLSRNSGFLMGVWDVKKPSKLTRYQRSAGLLGRLNLLPSNNRKLDFTLHH